MNNKRTLSQNAAIHKYFDLLAATLNAKGLTVEVVIKPDTNWTMESVKELIWRPVMQSVIGKKSTTKLTRQEVNDVYMALDAALQQKLDISVEFPHIEEKDK